MRGESADTWSGCSQGERRSHAANSEPLQAAVAVGRQPKLLDRVRYAIRAKHYSRRTESAYVDWVRRYIVLHRKRHPSEMGASEISAFLTWLAMERRVSASTQNQALSALLFLYRDVLRIQLEHIDNVPRARMPVRVPVVLSREEVARIMKHMDGVTWIIVALLYGAGLRLQECLELRVKDIDLVHYEGPLEVEVGLTNPHWAAVPPDPGTQEVMATGMKVLFERGHLLKQTRAIGAVRLRVDALTAKKLAAAGCVLFFAHGSSRCSVREWPPAAGVASAPAAR